MSLQPVAPARPEPPTPCEDTKPGETTATEQSAPVEELVADATESGWIEIAVIDDADRPVAGERFELTFADGRRIRGSTNAEGVAKLEKIPSGSYEFTLLRRDCDAWSVT